MMQQQDKRKVLIPMETVGVSERRDSEYVPTTSFNVRRDSDDVPTTLSNGRRDLEHTATVTHSTGDQ